MDRCLSLLPSLVFICRRSPRRTDTARSLDCLVAPDRRRPRGSPRYRYPHGLCSAKRCKSRRLDMGSPFLTTFYDSYPLARTRNPYARTRGLACAARGRGPGSRGPPPAPPLLSPTLMHLNGTQRESMPPHGCRAQGVCTCLLTAYSRMKSVCAEWAPRALHSVQSKVISGNQCKYSATRAPHSVRKVPISFHAACYAHT